MIPGSFDYHRPSSIDEAVGLLSDHGGDALILAGGHSLIPMMKLRMATPEHLIDIQGIDELSGIRVTGDRIEIGAAVTQADLIASDELAAACPILRETSYQIADPQIRNVGTIGGNVANGDPGNDMPAIMQLLDAEYVLRGKTGSRTVKAREFYEAAYFTARDEAEILTSVHIPTPAAGHGYSYQKQKRKIGDYATAAAGVILTVSGGQCTSASIALTNVADTPLWAEAAAQALVGTGLDTAAIAAAVDAARSITDPASDGRGPAEYRTHVAGIMVQRAIETAHERAA
ncbi:FAD binding domain-containing protein [Hoeflea prorocentri]|uniref:Xanthine dehydrogenase family protein subunit M n=1 Tax=Hoeflea prorocentri TaxID=1922333 RepID=A0A9X3ZF03_9HYPH|nr:xanthine dehydrogenase family protein subunit M [Hoeflea prorocentri]MCY6379166.1 xanthine dehydrogenase family protein subunit M [Hoeflea prorocentri]MDA5396967.1 xanthine dehydrogenase family protein subunit M [Hoeflea prorocentri]